jgi:AcrR family transcriptional regulator
MSSGPDEARKRRAPGEVERLIIDAAREVFAAKGYAGATTREIAGVAEVHEPMVYRRFGSKAKLFEATVLAPFNELISKYLDAYQPRPDPNASMEELARRFIEPFYELLRERRDLLLALFAAAEFHNDFSDDGTLTLTGFGHLIERLQSQLEIEAKVRPLHEIDVAAAIRVVIAMIMGVAILGDWLQPEGTPVAPDRLIDEMAKMSIYGINRAGGAGSGDGERATSLGVDQVAALLDRVAEAERRAIRAELELELTRDASEPRVEALPPGLTEEGSA